MHKKFLATRKLAILVLVLSVVILSWLGPIGEAADRYVDEGLKRSLISFASARVLNGVISVLQGTEVAVQPMGVGVTLTLGEILDPINDLVESFSSIMLLASVAFGVQKLLLTIGSNWMVSFLVTVIALVWAVLFYRNQVPTWLTQLVAVLIFVRFVMPVATIGSAFVFEQFSAKEYEASQSVLAQSGEKLKDFQPQDLSERAENTDTSPAPAEEPPAEPVDEAAEEAGDTDTAAPEVEQPVAKPSWSERFEAFKSSTKATVQKMGKAVRSPEWLSKLNPTDKVRRKFEEIKQAADNAVQNIINLIVIFIMQTIIVPLLLLWAFYRLTISFVQQAGPRRLSVEDMVRGQRPPA